MRADALVLFDIDGTLIRRAGPHHREALVEAVRHVTGLETTTENIPVHGMLDPDILSRMLEQAGASRALIRRSLAAIMERAQRTYPRAVPDLSRKTCPGARTVLSRLERHGVLMALVTGNLTRIGWKKLERAGLKRFFRYGAFGEMARDRAGLVRIAIRHARARGWSGADTRTSLIGDAPSDVIAAQANGVRSIAVHTGISTREELAAHHPDVLLEDLRALKLEMVL